MCCKVNPDPGLQKKGYYRVAVKLHEQNEKLIEVLEEVLS